MKQSNLETTEGNLQRQPWKLDGLWPRTRNRLEALVDPDLRRSKEWLAPVARNLPVPYNVAALLKWSRAHLLTVPGFGRKTLANLEAALRDYGIELEKSPRVVPERPVLFSAQLVRAILAGKKTVTRRVVRPMLCPLTGGPGRARLVHTDPVHGAAVFGDSIPDDPSTVKVNCPYGSEGDRLWVREAFHEVEAEGEIIDTVYRATDEECGVTKWTPSIHMPRRASRIDLEVVSVKVERIQSITADEVLAEGIEDTGYTNPTMGKRHESALVLTFQKLWDEINGSRVVRATNDDGDVVEVPGLMAWDANPWVWRVEFALVRPAPLADVIPIDRARKGQSA